MQHEAAHRGVDVTDTAIRREGVQLALHPDAGSSEPDLVSARRPGQPVQAAPGTRDREAFAVTLHDDDLAAVVAEHRMLGKRQQLAVG